MKRYKDIAGDGGSNIAGQVEAQHATLRATLFAGAVGLGLTAGACAPACCVGLLADHARPADRGIVMGLFEGACGLSFIVAGFVGGQTAAALGPEVSYLLVAGLALGWTVVLARQLPRGPARRPA